MALGWKLTIIKKITPSVLKYVSHLPCAGCDVMMMDVIRANEELISGEFKCCDWS